MTDTVAPVFAFASATFAKIGMPSKSSPGFFGLTPATKAFLPFAYSRHIRVWNWPVLPVIPCVITLVLPLMRMLIEVPPRLGTGRPRSWMCSHCGDDLLRGVGHVVRGDDRQPGIRENLSSELLVRAFHTDDERHLDLRLACGGDDAVGDRVAAHDAAEDV